jgi:hypothetical protein
LIVEKFQSGFEDSNFWISDGGPTQGKPIKWRKKKKEKGGQ